MTDGLKQAVVEHMIGSGSLLVRDAEGRFSFVHRSVMEWLVADAAARGLKTKGDAETLGANDMSELITRLRYLLSRTRLRRSGHLRPAANGRKERRRRTAPDF